MLSSLTKGLLITTDVPTKQLIQFLNNQNGKKIILKDLDDTHVLIDPAYEAFVKREVERLFDQNTYERKQEER